MARAVPSRLLPPDVGVASSLAEQAYYAIRDLIVTLELPPGAAVREPELVVAARHRPHPRAGGPAPAGAGAARRGLPRRGMFVTTVDVRDLARLCEVHAVLEPEAALLAAERATQADLDELQDLLAVLELRRRRENRWLIELDQRIHRTIYRASHNPFLAETLEQYYTHALRIWMLALARTDLGAAVHEHAELLDAILRGRGDRAAELMRAHVEAFEESMRDVLLSS